MHLSSTCFTIQRTNFLKSCYFQIRSISKIRKYLTEDSAKSLVHAFVTSRLDGMNSLLYKGLSYQQASTNTKQCSQASYWVDSGICEGLIFQMIAEAQWNLWIWRNAGNSGTMPEVMAPVSITLCNDILPNLFVINSAQRNPLRWIISMWDR